MPGARSVLHTAPSLLSVAMASVASASSLSLPSGLLQGEQRPNRDVYRLKERFRDVGAVTCCRFCSQVFKGRKDTRRKALTRHIAGLTCPGTRARAAPACQ